MPFHPRLRATEHHYRRIGGDTLVLRKPRCKQLLAALRGPTPLVVVVRMAVPALTSCLYRQLGRPAGEFECTPEAQLTAAVQSYSIYPIIILLWPKCIPNQPQLFPNLMYPYQP